MIARASNFSSAFFLFVCLFCFNASIVIFYRVLQLMNLTDSQLSQRGSEKLELSILSFFEQFRKMYVGDQAQKTSKVLSRISNPHLEDLWG